MRGPFVLLALLFLKFMVNSRVSPEAPKIQFPSDLREVHVSVGADRFRKSVAFEAADLGRITDIGYEKLPPAPLPQLAVVGTRGASFLNETLQQTSHVRFQSDGSMYSPRRVTLVHMDAGAALSFLALDAMHVVLFDQAGSPIWAYTNYLGINDAASGDVNADGVAEVVVGLNGFAGLRLLSANGRKLWGRYRDGNIWKVAIVPQTKSKPGKILHTEAGGELKVRDQSGVQVGNYRPDGEYISEFSRTRWWDDSEEARFVSVDEGRLFVFDSDGQRIARLPAPSCHRLGDVVGVPVHLAGGGSFYATVIEYRLFHRSVINLHEVGGELAFQEILEESCDAICAIPTLHGERLLVGCGGSVLEYTLAPNEKKTVSRKQHN